MPRFQKNPQVMQDPKLSQGTSSVSHLWFDCKNKHEDLHNIEPEIMTTKVSLSLYYQISILNPSLIVATALRS